MLSSPKSMDIRNYSADILLTVVMVIYTLTFILRFWPDITIAVITW